MIQNENDYKMIENYKTLNEINLFEMPNFIMETLIDDFQKDKWF